MTKKLLLADDSITIQKVIGIIFETEDYQLLVTDNGDTAFAKALEEQPDLVIADISMPGKDGFELCQAVKSDPRLASTSVMLLPGTFDHFDEQRAQTVGADGWLTKPFESQALLNKVAQLLETEPVRLSEDAAPSALAAVEETEELIAGFEPPAFAESVVAAVAAPVVDEAVLGLDEIAVEDASVMPEESADDIWDAISFEEDDLSPAAEGLEALSFAADADETPAVAMDVAEEAVEEFAVADAYRPVVEESIDQGAAFGFAEEDSFEAADAAAEEVSAFTAAAEESFDLDSAEIEPLEIEPAVATESYALQDESAAGVFELQDEVMEAPSVAASADVGFEELEPLQLAEETADVEEFAVEEPMLTETTTAAEPVFSVSEAYSEDESLLVEEADEEILELADEDILELADEDVFDEQPQNEEGSAGESDLTEGETGFASEPESFETEAVAAYEPELFAVAGFKADEAELPEAGDVAADDESGLIELADTDAVEADVFEPAEGVAESEGFSMEEAEPLIEEVAAPVAEQEETEAVAEFAADSFGDQFSGETDDVPQPDSFASQTVEEDEGFYFDASEAEESTAAEMVAEDTTGGAIESLAAAAVAASLTPESENEQVEQQLRQLSEEDLKEVVARVAGPIIEKLASEMLQQIAWEVVPDLAETMIREEIRKIKHAEA